MSLPKALVSWSSGKDSAFALHETRTVGTLEVVGLLTTVTTAFGRVSMHGVREELLRSQIVETGLPSFIVGIPSPCTNEVYEQELTRVLLDAKTNGVTHVIFGDLFLEDIRAYRVAMLSKLGLAAVFPLWQRDTRDLARKMIAVGLRATITCVDPRQLDGSFAGRDFDEQLLADLPACVDPCGERGEFHTFVTAGPMLSHRVAIVRGGVVEREGFVFADLLPVAGAGDAPPRAEEDGRELPGRQDSGGRPAGDGA
ncbi:MAG TPA: hypothetical protein VIX73_17140 [Kofleriaceae bacterium]|jgi:uncharacterized protein (TIGR00290 family)